MKGTKPTEPPESLDPARSKHKYNPPVINAKVRAGWDKFMSPIGRWLGRTNVNPNALTLAGVIIQIGSALLILEGRLLLAGVVGVLAGCFDALDGAVAKAQGRTTKFGAILDSTTDRLGDALVFIPVAWLYGVQPDVDLQDEPLIAALALGALVASFLVSYIKARAEGMGLECNVGIAERAERLIIMYLGLILNLVPIAVVMLLVLSVITFLQRLVHVHAQASGA